MTPFLIWMEKICKADEFVLSLQEIPEIAVGIEEVADSDEEVAMAAVETHQAQKPITGLLLRTYQAAPRGREISLNIYYISLTLLYYSAVD